jgi:hypothetical protein
MDGNKWKTKKDRQANMLHANPIPEWKRNPGNR